MEFICRRRLMCTVKIVAVFSLIWLAIAFLQYITKDTKPVTKWNGVSLKLFRNDGRGGFVADVESINNGVEFVNNNFVTLPHEDEAIKFKTHPIVTASTGKRKYDQQVNEKIAVLRAPVIVDDVPGAMGRPVVLPANLTAEIQKIVDKGWKNNAFNEYASDLMSLHRSLPDIRDPWCKEPGRYQQNLPVTDVIICFHNEAWSVLLRTVHSVLDRSPEELIGSIILVDDFSDMLHTKKQLDDYFEGYPKVKIIRAQKREGLIRARILGTRNAESPVLTFLDSHCECTEGWLEPLLDRIAKNSTTVVCPIVDLINSTTMEYDTRYFADFKVGGFNWNLEFTWYDIPESEQTRRNNSAEPIYSPTMLGGLFSIDRKFFEHLGTYDPDFNIWGSENLELSFKIWMCGGTLEIIPCSHVGHIFRSSIPYSLGPEIDVKKKNSVRLAEVWLDDYAKYYYQRIGYDKGDFGDVSARKELRKRLNCQSFKWYLENIVPELVIPEDPVAYGEIRNNLTSLCLHYKYPNPSIGLAKCHGRGGNQFFMLTKAGEIRRDEACLLYGWSEVTLRHCHGLKGNQFWTYFADSNKIRHDLSDKCLAIKHGKVIMEECGANRALQKWHLDNYDSSKLL